MIEIALVAIALLVITLTLGVPLPYCFGAALMVMYFIGDVTMRGMMLWGFQQLGNPVLLAIPLFVLAGTIMSESGIAASLLRFVNAFIGHVRGGLGVVAAVSCAVIGAISGSGLTGIAAIGPLLIPEMEKRGYPREYATALIANPSMRRGKPHLAPLTQKYPASLPPCAPGTKVQPVSLATCRASSLLEGAR